jgi:hypothetical protein
MFGAAEMVVCNCSSRTWWLLCYRDWTAERTREVTKAPTSKKDANKAGKLLSTPKTSKNVKSVAGSDLSANEERAKEEVGSSQARMLRPTRRAF